MKRYLLKKTCKGSKVNDINTKIIFKNKIYEMNTIDEVSSRLIRVFS